MRMAPLLVFVLNVFSLIGQLDIPRVLTSDESNALQLSSHSHVRIQRQAMLRNMSSRTTLLAAIPIVWFGPTASMSTGKLIKNHGVIDRKAMSQRLEYSVSFVKRPGNRSVLISSAALGDNVEHDSLGWGRGFPSSHDFHLAGNRSQEGTFIAIPKELEKNQMESDLGRTSRKVPQTSGAEKIRTAFHYRSFSNHRDKSR